MPVNRRAFTLALGAVVLSSIKSRPAEASESAFQIFYPPGVMQTFGLKIPLGDDVGMAVKILNAAPKTDPYEVMRYLAAVPEKSLAGEPFNERWDDFANPLLIKIFSDIRHPVSPTAGDCTPWCAATLSWCLQRCELPIPKDAPSALSFRQYGRPVKNPNVGDIVVFENIPSNGHGHVGLFVSRTTDSIRLLGANQANINVKTTTCGGLVA